MGGGVYKWLGHSLGNFYLWSRVTNQNKHFVFILLSTLDPDSTVSALVKAETCLCLAPQPASAAGQMLNTKITIQLNGDFGICCGAR